MMKGNIVDLAVAVVIGGAFGKIVSSLVNDIIMPVLGVVLGRVNLSKLKYVIRPEREGVAELSIKYDQFIQSVIDFLLIGISIFIFVKIIKSFKKKEEEIKKPTQPSREEILLTEIRDLLRERKDI